MINYKYTLCFIRRNNEILMINRIKKPEMGVWNGVGGRIEPGESADQCVRREVWEETGVELEQVRCAGRVTWLHPKGDSGMVVFIADLPRDQVCEMPRAINEGILDWKDINWVLHPDNKGISDNISVFLPLMLESLEAYDHIFTYDVNDRMLDYVRVPLEVGSPR